MNYDLENVDNWLAKNKLCLNVDKTHFMLIGTPQRLSNLKNDDLNANVKGFRLQRIDHCKYLGIEVDKHLLWHNQIDQVRKKKSFDWFIFPEKSCKQGRSKVVKIGAAIM